MRFTDGSEVKADVVVYCTGYKVTFPFFDEGFISAPDNDLPLFRRIFHPDIPNVFFIGLLQPLGAIMPLAERAVGVGLRLPRRAATRCPRRPTLRADMERERRAMFTRYVASKRHTMQVDFDDYLAALAKERKAGRSARAARGTAAGAGRAARRSRRDGAALAGGRREATKAANRAAILAAAPRRLRRARLRRGRRARHRPPHRARLGHVLQLLPRQGRRSSARSCEEVGAEARRRVRARAPGGRDAARRSSRTRYRAYFAFIVEDPATSAFLARNAGAIRGDVRGVARLPAGIERARRGPARGDRAPGWLPELDVDYCAHAMVAVGLELGRAACSSASRPTSRARRASRPTCSLGARYRAGGSPAAPALPIMRFACSALALPLALPPLPPPSRSASPRTSRTMFTDPLFTALGVKQARVVVSWTSMTQRRRRAPRASRSTCTPRRRAGIEPLVDVRARARRRDDLRQGKNRRSASASCRRPRDYEHDAAGVPAALPVVQHVRRRGTRSTTSRSRPRATRRRRRSSPTIARKLCPGCTIVVADVLDQADNPRAKQPTYRSTLRYIKQFRTALKARARSAGMHNYSDVNRFRDDRHEGDHQGARLQADLAHRDRRHLQVRRASAPSPRRQLKATKYMFKLARAHQEDQARLRLHVVRRA